MAEANQQRSGGDTPRARWRLGVKLAVLAVVVAAAALVYWQFRDVLRLDWLAKWETELRRMQVEFPALVFGAAFLLYILVTGMSLPGATVLSLVFGWYFGFWQALLLVSFASTAGATLAFLLSRYLMRDTIQDRFGARLATFNRALEDEGAFYLFTLRLIPAVPFFVINVVMGLTPMRPTTFWWVSQLGMLPGTCVYVYAGSAVPDLGTLAEQGAAGILSWKLAFAFVLLGLFPLAVRRAVRWYRAK